MAQHYVPRVYLRNFAEQKRKEHFVTVFDKTTGQFFETNIKNICAEKDFYTLEDNTKLPKGKMAIDRVYSDFIEPMYYDAYKILTNDDIHYITEKDRATILLGVMQLYLRNPAVLLQLIEQHRNQVKKEILENRAKGIKGVTYLEEDYSFSEYTDDMIILLIEEAVTKFYKEQHIIGTTEIFSFHADAKFQVEKIKGKAKFFTSDNPLVMEDTLVDNKHPLLRSKHFRIALNKEYSLEIMHDNRKETNRIYRCFAGDGNVWSLNRDIVANSSRFIVADQGGMETYKEYEKFMDEESPEKMVNVLRQLVDKWKGDKETERVREIMQEFLNDYDNGKVNEFDFQAMYQKTLAETKEIMKERIKS